MSLPRHPIISSSWKRACLENPSGRDRVGWIWPVARGLPPLSQASPSDSLEVACHDEVGISLLGQASQGSGGQGEETNLPMWYSGVDAEPWGKAGEPPG